MVLDDEDERLWLKRNGHFEAEVVPEREDGDESKEGAWKRLSSPDDIVEFYDPTDVFGDLAEALAESYPQIAGEEDAGDEDADDVEDADEDDTDDTDDGDDTDGDDEPHASPNR
jgi:hypothetical protein